MIRHVLNILTALSALLCLLLAVQWLYDRWEFQRFIAANQSPIGGVVVHSTHWHVGQAPGWVVILLLSLLPLARVLIFVQRRVSCLRQRESDCPRCGYDLTGNVSGACPECGRNMR